MKFSNQMGVFESMLYDKGFEKKDVERILSIFRCLAMKILLKEKDLKQIYNAIMED